MKYKHYKVVGITGGMGSGKSFVCNKIKQLGYSVYEADSAAKEVMLQPIIMKKIQEAFGQESYTNGQINRNYLTKVFQNRKELQKLNEIVHPAVAEHFHYFLEHLKTDKSLVFKEAAILFESGTWKSCDFVITIFAPLGIRMQRIIQRDSHLSIEQIHQRIAQQWNDEWKVKNSHFTIFNDGFQNLDNQILKMIHFISTLHEY